LVQNEIAQQREVWWRIVDDGLSGLEGRNRWSDDDLAELILTGASALDGFGAPPIGWGFPLCPIDARRGQKKIAGSLPKERARARRRRTV